MPVVEVILGAFFVALHLLIFRSHDAHLKDLRDQLAQERCDSGRYLDAYLKLREKAP